MLCSEEVSETTSPTADIIEARENIANMDLVVLRLQNGMKVCLKKTASEDEIVMRLTAAGGYSSLPKKDRASAQLSSQVAMRSGIGHYHFNQLYSLLYDHSIEFDSDVQPFCRYIEGQARLSDFEALLRITQLFFTESCFTEHAFQKVVAKTKEKISHQSNRSHKNFQELYMSFNIPGVEAFQPLTEKDLALASFESSKKYFNSSFSNPHEFVCVITGSFEMEEMVELVAKYLAKIPAGKECAEGSCSSPSFPVMAEEAKKKTLCSQAYASGDSVTVLTLPISKSVTRENFTSLNNISSLLYIRLKQALRDKYGVDSVIIDVSIEYPFYPCLASPWIKIQFFNQPHLLQKMQDTIFAELKKIQQEGVNQEEILVMNRKYKKSEQLREKDNVYWIGILSNYLLWGWNVSNLSEDLKPLTGAEDIKEGLKSSFSVNNYRMITALP